MQKNQGFEYSDELSHKSSMHVVFALRNQNNNNDCSLVDCGVSRIAAMSRDSVGVGLVSFSFKNLISVLNWNTLSFVFYQSTDCCLTADATQSDSPSTRLKLFVNRFRGSWLSVFDRQLRLHFVCRIR